MKTVSKLIHSSSLSGLMPLLAMLAMLVASGCGGTQGKQLDRAEAAIFDEQPDSALVFLENVDAARLTSQRDKARYALYRTAAEYFAGASEYSDSAFSADAIPYFGKHGCKRDKMLCLYLAGVFDMERSDYQQAVAALLKSAGLAEQLDDHFYLGRHGEA